MSQELTANDIFEIAVKIEQNGALFYRDSAKAMEDNEHKQFLLKLAKMEENHIHVFSKLQKELIDDEATSLSFDSADENALYLKALADTQVFFGKKKPGNDFKEILISAIQAEKDSIAFYTGLKEIISKESGQLTIDAIIKEEMSHIRLLGAKLSAYIFDM